MKYKIGDVVMVVYEGTSFTTSIVGVDDREDRYFQYIIIDNKQQMLDNDANALGTSSDQDIQFCRRFGMTDFSQSYYWIREDQIDLIKLSQMIVDGCRCIECFKFIKMAIPNLENNKFVCYGCKDSNRWKYG